MKKTTRIIVLCFCLLMMCAENSYAVEYNWTVDTEGNRVAMPVAYAAIEMVDYFGPGVGSLSNAQDIYYRDGLLYVADTGNNRILVLDGGLRAQAIYTSGEKRFSAPHGVYADADGDIFVADTNNNQIVHLAPDGTFVESFGQPDSELYDAAYGFRPLKLCIDTVGQFYIINREDYHGFTVIDALGQFKGYVAPTKVGTSILEQLVDLLATDEQKEQLDRKLPPVHTNFFMDETGAVYVTTSRTEQAQLKKFLSYGNNIFPYTGSFGTGEETSSIVDVTVNADGIITLLEQDSGLLFQYDSDGTLLCSFGGSGNWMGCFMQASSLCEDENGRIYVLDAGTGAITVFEPTSFITKVHHALGLLQQGRYDESMIPWREVLEIDRNYSVARIGMGKAYMRQEKYSEALEQYTIAQYRAGYSDAFAGLRHEFFREHFGWMVVAALALLVAVLQLVKICRRYAQKLSTSL